MQRQLQALTNAEIGELDELLASIHAPLQPMDASALDGYLCGVLLQPVTISPAAWLPLVLDIEGTTVPADSTTQRIGALAQRRLAELNAAVAERLWFDPWIFEPDEPDAPPSLAQLPWVAGFAAAMERFPALMNSKDPALIEPMAVLYAVFDPDDLDEADDLLPIIETLEPPSSMAEAAEDLVRSVLLLADVSRPRPAQRAAASRRGPPLRRRF